MWSLIAQTVDFVVHIDLVRNEMSDEAPVRRITSIVEVGGLGEAGGVSTTEVWGIGRDGELDSSHPRRHQQRLRLAGFDTSLFASIGSW